MKFKVLGPVTVMLGEEDITPRTPKIRSLLAILSLNSNRNVSTEYLTSILWPDGPPRTAPTALQVYVSKLRKHFGDSGTDFSGLVTRSPGYMLCLDGHSFDLHEFDMLTSQAACCATEGRSDEALELLTGAMALWTGAALADLRGVPTFNSIGRRLDERLLEAHERRFELELRLGHQRGVVSELYGLASDHPTWEAIHWYLMIALYRNGRVAESLTVYQEMRREFVDRLGMEPSLRLQQLQSSILARSSWLDDPSLCFAA